jgi:cysteine desulfurase family protein (TIGR01976 family)
MTPLDLAAVRRRFPALSLPGPGGLPPVHADAPGGTQVLDSVVDAMRDYLVERNGNSHGPFPASRATDRMCEEVRAQAGVFLGSQPEGIVFGQNMTTLTLHFSHAFSATLRAGDEIVCTRLDHDANVAPWLLAAERCGATVRWIQITAEGRLDLETLGQAITARTRLVAFPAASNALGTLVDPEPLVAAAREVGARTFCDGVHAAPHVPLDRVGMGVDVLVCSPYKFFGPHAGLLAADPALLADLNPEKVRPAPDAGPERWQTGTSSFEAIAGTGAALSYLSEIGMDRIRAHEALLSGRFLDGLAQIRHTRLYGPPGPWDRTPTFSLTVAGLTPGAVSERLAARGIYTWSGHYYAVEPLRALGLLEPGAGAVRIGFTHYHGSADVDRVLEALHDLG